MTKNQKPFTIFPEILEETFNFSPSCVGDRYSVQENCPFFSIEIFQKCIIIFFLNFRQRQSIKIV